MPCQYLYEGKCNLTNTPCWFTTSGIEECCTNYKPGEPVNWLDNPDHERDIKED